MCNEGSEKDSEPRIATRDTIEYIVSDLMRGQARPQGDESTQPWLQSTARPNNSISTSAGATSKRSAFGFSVRQEMQRLEADDFASCQALQTPCSRHTLLRSIQGVLVKPSVVGNRLRNANQRS